MLKDILTTLYDGPVSLGPYLAMSIHFLPTVQPHRVSRSRSFQLLVSGFLPHVTPSGLFLLQRGPFLALLRNSLSSRPKRRLDHPQELLDIPHCGHVGAPAIPDKAPTSGRRRPTEVT